MTYNGDLIGARYPSSAELDERVRDPQQLIEVLNILPTQPDFQSVTSLLGDPSATGNLFRLERPVTVADLRGHLDGAVADTPEVEVRRFAGGIEVARVGFVGTMGSYPRVWDGIAGYAAVALHSHNSNAGDENETVGCRMPSPEDVEASEGDREYNPENRHLIVSRDGVSLILPTANLSYTEEEWREYVVGLRGFDRERYDKHGALRTLAEFYEGRGEFVFTPWGALNDDMTLDDIARSVTPGR